MTIPGIRQFGIAFSTEMVEAILDGRKTETRRLASDTSPLSKAVAGDLLWIKEGFEVLEWLAAARMARIRYLTRCTADGVLVSWPERLAMGRLGLKLPRFMPREASRIELGLTEAAGAARGCGRCWSSRRRHLPVGSAAVRGPLGWELAPRCQARAISCALGQD